MSDTPEQDLRTKAAAIRYREMGSIHAEKIAQKIRHECLTLTKREKEIIRDQIALLLMEVFKGQTILEPNPFQQGAAAAGKEEITDADMLMFAAKMEMAQKMLGRQLTGPEQREVILQVAMGSPTPRLENKGA